MPHKWCPIGACLDEEIFFPRVTVSVTLFCYNGDKVKGGRGMDYLLLFLFFLLFIYIGSKLGGKSNSYGKYDDDFLTSGKGYDQTDEDSFLDG